MERKKTVYGIHAANMAQLLRLGTEAFAVDMQECSDQAKADQLRDYMAGKLPVMASPLHSFQNTLRSAMGDPIEDHLFCSQIDLSTIKAIKAYGARLGRMANSKVQKEPAHVIYYASIAVALVIHQQRITEFGLDALAQSFGQLSELPWMTSKLKRLFQDAIEVCHALNLAGESDE